MRNLRLACTALALAAFGLALPAMGQDRIPVQFARGTNHITLHGAIIGSEYVDYTLGARGGQSMIVNLRVDGTNGNGSINFNILPPGSTDVAIYNSSEYGNVTRIRLPRNGTYTIRVYLMGNDRDTGRTVGYDLEVGIR